MTSLRSFFALGSLVLILAACAGPSLDPAGTQPLPSAGGAPGGGVSPGSATADAATPSEAPPAGVRLDTWKRVSAEFARVIAKPANAHRRVSAAGQPPSGAAAVALLHCNEGTATLSWGMYSPGDCDQNGEVGLPDLTPIALHFGEVSPAGAGQPFPEDSLGGVIDGSDDGDIGLPDVTPIGANFGNRLEGYRVYGAESMTAYPASPDAPNNPGAVYLGEVALDAASPDGGRRQFAFALTGLPAARFYWVRPYSGALEGAASTAVEVVPGVVNDPPHAVLSATPDDGLTPLTVTLDGSRSFDLDGSIVRYEWDFDGPAGGENWVESGAADHMHYQYTVPGTYLVALRVTDDLGASATTYVKITAREPIPPTASLSVSPPAAPCVVRALWDSGASTAAPGAAIVRHEWDWNGDGQYDYDSGIYPGAYFYYYSAGSYGATVRVTDSDGLQATASGAIEVAEGATWHSQVILESEATDTGGRYLEAGNLFDVGGKPAFCYSVIDQPESGENADVVYFLKAKDKKATSWEAPVLITDDQDNPPDYFDGLNAAVINGTPTLILNRGFRAPMGFQGQCFMTSALDSAGSAWEVPHMIYGRQAYSPQPPMTIGGNPAFFMFFLPGKPISGFCRALDPEGQVWAEQVRFITNFVDRFASMQEIAGRPAFITAPYSEGSGSLCLAFNRALNVEGTQWPASPVVLAQSAKGYASGGMIIAYGRPAVVYIDSVLGQLCYMRSLDSTGAAWDEPVPLAIWASDLNDRSQTYSMVSEIDGRPLVLYSDATDPLNKQMRFIAACDQAGDYWSDAVLIDTTESSPLALVGVNGSISYLAKVSFYEDPTFYSMIYVNMYY